LGLGHPGLAGDVRHGVVPVIVCLRQMALLVEFCLDVGGADVVTSNDAA
jgi:hypothetical protein